MEMESGSNSLLTRENVIIQLLADTHCERKYYHQKNSLDSTLSGSSLHYNLLKGKYYASMLYKKIHIRFTIFSNVLLLI